MLKCGCRRNKNDQGCGYRICGCHLLTTLGSSVRVPIAAEWTVRIAAALHLPVSRFNLFQFRTAVVALTVVISMKPTFLASMLLMVTIVIGSMYCHQRFVFIRTLFSFLFRIHQVALVLLYGLQTPPEIQRQNHCGLRRLLMLRQAGTVQSGTVCRCRLPPFSALTCNAAKMLIQRRLSQVYDKLPFPTQRRWPLAMTTMRQASSDQVGQAAAEKLPEGAIACGGRQKAGDSRK